MINKVNRFVNFSDLHGIGFNVMLFLGAIEAFYLREKKNRAIYKNEKVESVFASILWGGIRKIMLTKCVYVCVLYRLFFFFLLENVVGVIPSKESRVENAQSKGRAIKEWSWIEEKWWGILANPGARYIN